MNVADLPIAPLLPRIRAALAAQPRLVVEAPPGAGKTTQVPPALLATDWLAGRMIVLLEPRRIAARAAAEFMAAQRGEAIGRTVGYRIRFEARVSDATRILVVTEGILTRMLQDDPELAGIGAVIFDEFHERHLQGDLGATLALDVQASLRPDLRIVVMSATLAGDAVAQWLDAPVLQSAGRAFPVRIGYPPPGRGEAIVAHTCRAVQQALHDTAGDVLVFLPGRREIADAQRMLSSILASPAGTGAGGEGSVRRGPGRECAPSSSPPGHLVPQGEGNSRSPARIEVLPLHGELALADQCAALAPADPGTRRVILATNVAESSLTVPGVTAVVDTGLAREPRFDPNSGFTRLATITVSQASADQRAGRAGRTAPGIAYRLWPESRRLEPGRSPEIAQAELSGLALELAAWGIGAGATTLRWLDPPPAGALAAGRALLQLLGALDADLRITPLGRRILALGTDPRLAAAALGAPEALRPLASDLLALLETRSPLRAGFDDDVRARLAALHRYRDGGTRALQGADARALAAIEQVARGWRRRLGTRHGASGVPGALTVGNLLLHAFPDRAARQDEREPQRYRLANGRGVRLHPESTLFGERWLVIVEARFDARDSLVLVAAPFDGTLLEREFSARIATRRVVACNERGAVEAYEERRFDALVLERKAAPVGPDDALPALLAEVRSRGLDVLPWTDASRRLRARIAWLARVLPEATLPDVSDAALLDSLETWLAPALTRRRKLAALSAPELSEAFGRLLDWRQRKLLDASAPEALTVPSGRALKIDYTVIGEAGSTHAGCGAGGRAPDDGRESDRNASASDLPSAIHRVGANIPSPVLAVKLQELFGLAETPRIAGGRVPVTLHLLSPAGRPIQVTQDLRGFWNHTYPDVRKELKGRYPRHPWPEDPWTATPTHRTKPRR